MVFHIQTSPDPQIQTQDDNITMNSDLIFPVGVNSDSDDEELSHDGYELLPQNGVVYSNDEESEQEENSVVESTSAPTEAQNDSPRSSTSSQASIRTEPSQLWNPISMKDAATGIDMDATKADQVRNAMANFTLPPSAIPAWASNVPEESWRQLLIDKINCTVLKNS